MQDKLRFSLFFLRITVFLVMFMWTIDKYFRPEHASLVYETFYFSPGFGSIMSYLIATAEMLIILGFVLGIMKTWTYGLVLFFHFISTISAFGQYFSPFEGPNLLFFAAWPMLAACVTLFLLRDEDTLLTVM